MFACKKFSTFQGLMLAACDQEVLGKKLKYGKIEIEINKDFYFEKFCSKEELIELLREAKIINLFGNRIMKIILELKLAKKEDFKIIDGIAHIQIYRL